MKISFMAIMVTRNSRIQPYFSYSATQNGPELTRAAKRGEARTRSVGVDEGLDEGFLGLDVADEHKFVPLPQRVSGVEMDEVLVTAVDLTLDGDHTAPGRLS